MRYQRHLGTHYQGWIHPEFSPPEQLLETPEKAGELPGAEPVLDCRGRQIFRTPLKFQDGPHSCFTYYFKNSSVSRSLRSCYAFQSLKISEKLRAEDFGTLEVVAAVKKKGEWLNWHSLVVAREIESVHEIASEGHHIYQVHPAEELSPKLAGQLARELVRFHTRGFFHGDLKTRHILVRTDSTARFFFVDLEKCRYLPRLPRLLRDVLAARDLIQLLTSLPGAFTASNHLVRDFLECYLEAAGLPLDPPPRIVKMVNLYSQEGPLSQGQTVLSGLVRRSK
ncbi:MAG: lipopolysaccharide kinase InaA family protein [Acidobacteriota bacterium]|nr:lipopolysaccharide kinase InaA family protein [Acidobacteriota bacterium]